MEEVQGDKGLGHYLWLVNQHPLSAVVHQLPTQTSIFKCVHVCSFTGAQDLGSGYETSTGILTLQVRTARRDLEFNKSNCSFNKDLYHRTASALPCPYFASCTTQSYCFFVVKSTTDNSVMTRCVVRESNIYTAATQTCQKCLLKEQFLQYCMVFFGVCHFPPGTQT